MVSLSKDVDVLIHESTFDEALKNRAVETGHSTAAGAARIAKDAGVKNLILTHISTRYQDTEKLHKEAFEIFEDTTLACDFMTFKIERT
jgi:ribonuclease Z